MKPRTLRVVIAEDPNNPTLSRAIAVDETLDVVGIAAEGAEAVDLTRCNRPDIVVVDAGIRRMDGFETTRRIMQETPTPVIVVSETTDRNDVLVSSEALHAGAVAAVRKPLVPGTLEFAKRSLELLETIHTMAGVRVVRRWADTHRRAPERNGVSAARPSIVAIASSTGGPAALREILCELPEQFALPIVVVQHIATGFVGGFVRWLNDTVALNVKVAEDGDALAPSTVYVGPDGFHVRVARERRIVLGEGEPIDGHCPSGTVLFESVAAFGPKSVCIVLTGMGNDGVNGLRAVRKSGGVVIAQDEATCAVFGMPKAALDAGLTDLAMSPKAIARYITLRADASLGES